MSITWGDSTDTDFFQQAMQEWRESNTDRATMSFQAIPPKEMSRILLRAQELKQQHRAPGRFPMFA